MMRGGGRLALEVAAAGARGMITGGLRAGWPPACLSGIRQGKENESYFYV